MNAITSNFVKYLARPCMFSTSSQHVTNHYDIIIAGGGMIGSSLACTLGKNSLLKEKSILLLEGGTKASYDSAKPYRNRVVSVNPGTRQLLNDNGIWDYAEKGRYGTIKKMQVWDALSEAMITFNSEVPPGDIAYVVENDLLISGAFSELEKIENVKVTYNAKVKHFDLPNEQKDQSTLTLENGDIFTCKLLLGCDGVKSKVRDAMSAQYIEWNYDQVGIVATLHLSEPCNNIVGWQRFLPEGPVALLPLSDELSSLVWSTSPSRSQELLKLSDSDFVDCLNNALTKEFKTESFVSDAIKVYDKCLQAYNFPSTVCKQLPPKISKCEENSRAAFPLGFGHSTNYLAKGVVLVGDSAHRVHPLAGQGVNLGFGDIVCLNRILGNAVYCGSDLEDMSYLKDYESQRQAHVVPTMLAIEGLHRLYTTNVWPVVLLRSIGLQTTHALTSVKRMIVDHASV